MKKYVVYLMLIIVSTSLAACVSNPTQGRYLAFEVGQPLRLETGYIIAMRNVNIRPVDLSVDQSLKRGYGMILQDKRLLSTANNGQLAVIIRQATKRIVVAQSVIPGAGIEYTIRKNNGQTVMIIQPQNFDEQPLYIGQSIILQESPFYTRILPAQMS